MTREQVHDMARALNVSEQTEAEMQLGWMMRREQFNETGLHYHMCEGCGAQVACYNSTCVTDRAYQGEALSEADCVGSHERIH